MPAISNATKLEEELAWLALRMVPTLGAKRAVPLVQRYKSPVAVFRASAAELAGQGLPGSVAHSIASGCAFDDAVDQQRRMERAGTELITYCDPRYPPLLKQIYDPPLVLFARGRTELLQRPGLGVVGTRRPTPYGIAATERLSRELAGTGLVITSGLARGIDTAAHRGTLEAGGDTIAVFGSGVDHIYPAENRRLAEQIAAKGLLLSEFPMGNPGHPQNFPIRNRIISGLSLGVMVVEGAQYSGSAITAQLAIEQNREVFAVPGNITSKMSWAPNLLIKQGAKLVQAAEDVLTELPVEVRQQLRIQLESGGTDGASYARELDQALGPNARLGHAILEIVPVETAMPIDAVMEKLDNWSSSEVLAVLFELQLLGHVRELPGKNFVKVWAEPAAKDRSD